MGKKVDITGRRFGRLVAVSETDHYSGANRKWNCVCDCGNEKLVSKDRLKSGVTRSCGCLMTESRVKHGMADKPVYESYRSMMKRCYTPKTEGFDNYGGRGIKVCERWFKSFENFYADMGDRPVGKTLDRIDVDGDYSPENCQWVTWKEQARNKRGRKKEFHNGQQKPISEWAEIYGIAYATLWRRLYVQKLPIDKALEPVK